MTKYTLEVKEHDDGDLYIEFPDELMKEAGWKIGDVLNWEEKENGNIILTRKDTELVMVECVSTFRIRYLVQVPSGKSDYALDSVTLNEAKEFSQKFLDETIVSHRVVSREEAFKMCDEDNDYASKWTEDKKIEQFFTMEVDDGLY